MSTTLPTDPHDFALWLFETLECVRQVATSALWEGKLPTSCDFDEVEAHLDGMPGALSGSCRAETRMIGFYPTNAHVYESLAQMLAVEANRRRVPAKFTLRDTGLTLPIQEQVSTTTRVGTCPADDASEKTPSEVLQYVEAVRLWTVLHELADVRNGGLLFVASHDAQLEIRADFGIKDLRPLPAFARFAGEFANPESHADQKRAIVRNVLIDQFKPRRSVALADVLVVFDQVATDARQSLSMYMAEFSVKKVLGEVERLNLDDTLKLNKTLSDIQNQLLALPAAILLAGATIRVGEQLRNYAVLAGVFVFCVVIWTLVTNQRHSISAISAQIKLRKTKIEAMPGDSNREVLELFPPLESRVRRQGHVLTFIAWVVACVLLLTSWAVIDASNDGVIVDLLRHAATRWAA